MLPYCEFCMIYIYIYPSHFSIKLKLVWLNKYLVEIFFGKANQKLPTVTGNYDQLGRVVLIKFVLAPLAGLLYVNRQNSSKNTQGDH